MMTDYHESWVWLEMCLQTGCGSDFDEQHGNNEKMIKIIFWAIQNKTRVGNYWVNVVGRKPLTMLRESQS